MKKIFSIILALGMTANLFADERWTIAPDKHTIIMNVADQQLPHSDHIEMSGERMAVVLYWDLDSNAKFGLNRALVFPMLRTIPNNTHGSLMLNNDVDVAGMLRINHKRPNFISETISIDGLVEETSVSRQHDGATIELTRTIFPTMRHQAMVEIYSAKNIGEKPLNLIVPELNQKYSTDPDAGVKGSYIIEMTVNNDGNYTLAPGDSTSFCLVVQAYEADGGQASKFDTDQELAERKTFIDFINNNLVLKTPDEAIDTEFRYAKIRGAESIYKTKGGYMHGPGGESYYAALWCNDQAEYINPFFPFLGYPIGNESALNCFRHYARYMNDDYNPIPSSIFAEGEGIWNGAGDRGDAAMLAYGASRYALARGDKDEASELWPLIEWCLEYCRRQLNEEGVVKSDHDELEGRFPAGDANLCTASLYYDALISASYLGKDLGKPSKQLVEYRKQAAELRQAIERHFGRNVQGFDTYRYYDGNDVLRSWICIPLVMGIDERAAQTVKALFSPEMYTKDGVLTCQGNPIFWDRATLYTLRGALYAGYPDDVLPKLTDFSRRRLLGDHVPYPVEAWPEGSQRHLSAESGLYCRIITEGLFGLRPTGLRSFELKPQLPVDWDYAELCHIRSFGSDFDIIVKRKSADKLEVSIINHTLGKNSSHTIRQGQTLKIKL